MHHYYCNFELASDLEEEWNNMKRAWRTLIGLRVISKSSNKKAKVGVSFLLVLEMHYG